ncbi:MAG: FtsX-like permease family protein [Anaerolineae bacterium]|nr:FtsX-like permease family protein [Anaerolineae bacterium]
MNVPFSPLPDSLWRVMFRTLRRRPFQSVMFVLGVALGVAMMVAIDLANTSASRAFSIFTESLTGRTTHQIVAGPGGVPSDLYRQIRLDLRLRESAPVVTAYVEALELGSQPLRIFGIDPFAEAPFRGYLNLGVGSNTNTADMAAFLTEPNTVLMAESLAAQYGLKEGDNFTVRYGPTRHTVKIAGLLRPSDDLTAEGLRDMLITDVSAAQELLGMKGRLTNIDLIIPQGEDGEALFNQIRAILPPGAILQPAAAKSSAVGQMTQAFNLSLTALSLLALVVGMFLIYNTVTFSVVQRRPVLGIFRALGVTRRQIFSMILVEAMLLSIIGALIGLVVGVIMGRLAVILVTQTVSSLYFTVSVRGVEVPLLSLIKGLAIGVGAALLAAAIPAYEATTTPPAGALKRSDIETKVRRAVPALTVIGLVIVGGAFALLSTDQLALSFAGLFAIILGFSLLTPVVSLVLMHLVRPITGAAAGVLGLIAPRSIIRSLSRTSVAVAALMVAVSVIVGVSAMVGSFRRDVQVWLENTIRADILIGPPSISAIRQDVPIDPSVGALIASVPGIDRVGVVRHADAIRVGDPLPVYLTVIDVDISEGKRMFVWALGDYDAVWAALGEGAVVVSETFARQRGIPIGAGQQISLVTDKGEHTFPIAAFMVDYSGDQGTVLLRMPVYHNLYEDRMISNAAAFITPGASLEEVIKNLQAAFAGKYELIVSSNQQLRSSVLVVFDQTFAITTALNLLATVVAFIGILSALSALQLERTREFGTMRANGMTRRQLFQVTLMETGLMGAVAGVMALPVGSILAWVLVYIINVRSFGWTLQLQLRPEFYVQAVAVSLVAAHLAGIYPALRIGRIQPALAVRSE